ncbi:MAG: hypothetical protein ACOCXC_04950 [Fibrobacterota bacterium]
MTENLLFLVAGFVIGGIAASIVWALSSSVRKKHQKSRQEAKEQVMLTIGELLADADAITGDFRCGNIDLGTLRKDLNEKINSITKLFRTNMHVLDVFFVKYTEQQIETHQQVMENPERRRPDFGAPGHSWGYGVQETGGSETDVIEESDKKRSEPAVAEFDSSEQPEVVADHLESVAEQFEAVLEHPSETEQEDALQGEQVDMTTEPQQKPSSFQPEEEPEKTTDPQGVDAQGPLETEPSPAFSSEESRPVEPDEPSEVQMSPALASEEPQAVEEDFSIPEEPSEIEQPAAGETQDSEESAQPQEPEPIQAFESDTSAEPVSTQAFQSDEVQGSDSEAIPVSEEDAFESSSDSEIVFEMPVEESDEETGTFEEPTWSEQSFEDFEASFAQFEAAVEEKSRAALSKSQAEQDAARSEPEESQIQQQPEGASDQMSDMEQALAGQGYEVPSEEDDQFLTETICFDRRMIPTDGNPPGNGSAQEPREGQNRMRHPAAPKGAKPPLAPDQQAQNVQPPASEEKDQSAITGDDVINTIDNLFGL